MALTKIGCQFFPYLIALITTGRTCENTRHSLCDIFKWEAQRFTFSPRESSKLNGYKMLAIVAFVFTAAEITLALLVQFMITSVEITCV